MQFIYNIDPIAFHLFGFDVYWYGIAYFISFIISIFYAQYSLKGTAEKIKPDILSQYIVVGVLLGGRVGYALLYNFNFLYSKNLFLRGGMSFHGGLIGAGLACALYGYKKNVNFWKVTDLVSVCAPIGIFFGRIANAINNEIPGKISNYMFSVWHESDLTYRHPVSIYEAITEGLLLWIIMFFTYKKFRKNPGITTSFFTIDYSICRYLVEFFKDDEIFCLQQTYGQFLSIIMFIIGVSIFFFQKTKK